MKIEELHDELGEGIGLYMDGKFFELRDKEDVQSRIYGDNNDSKARILVGYSGGEKIYNYFKVFVDRINRLFEISIPNEEEDFIRYLNKGFEKSFGSGRMKVNPDYKGLEELKKYIIIKARKYGLLTEALGWIGLIIGTCVNLKLMAVIMGFYFVFGDIICGLLVSWLADLDVFISPFFQIGAYPANRHFLKRYILLDKSLSAHFKRRRKKLKELKDEFARTEDVRRKFLLSRSLEREERKMAKEWEPVALSFIKCNEFKGVIVEYKGRYQDSFAFCNYIINGIEPKEEELDVWRIRIEEPPEEGRGETDFDRIWE